MKIYTRTGDAGDTTCSGGRRVRKSDVQVTAGGEIDELNAHIGSCLQTTEAAGAGKIAEALRPLPGELFVVGALLAAAGTDAKPNVSLDESAVRRMEGVMDRAGVELPQLTHFVLPGGCELACRLHVARTICRRAERAVVRVADAGIEVPPVVLKYLNRLGDLLFVLAREANFASGATEAVWKP